MFKHTLHDYSETQMEKPIADVWMKMTLQIAECHTNINEDKDEILHHV